MVRNPTSQVRQRSSNVHKRSCKYTTDVCISMLRKYADGWGRVEGITEANLHDDKPPFHHWDWGLSSDRKSFSSKAANMRSCSSVAWVPAGGSGRRGNDTRHKWGGVAPPLLPFHYPIVSDVDTKMVVIFFARRTFTERYRILAELQHGAVQHIHHCRIDLFQCVCRPSGGKAACSLLDA